MSAKDELIAPIADHGLLKDLDPVALAEAMWNHRARMTECSVAAVAEIDVVILDQGPGSIAI